MPNMKTVITAALMGLAAGPLCFAQGKGKEKKAETPSMKTVVDSNSYAIGLNIGQSVRKDSIEINVDMLRAGIVDAMQGPDNQRFNDSTAQALLIRLQESAMARAQMRAKVQQQAAGETNKKMGEEFLKANKSKPGVRTTASGLQYIVMNEGSGDSPDLNDVVKVYYRGTLIDGTEFDRTQEGKPVEFPVDGVIAGWTEALQLMKPGAKWKLFIPSGLAYGESGAGGAIGPNSVLIFEVELLSVQKQ